MADERITALPTATAASVTDTEWRVIRAGKELGPMSLATELVGKAFLGEVGADDLVKQTGGLWTKARDFGFLQEQFLPKKPREEASPAATDKLSRPVGIDGRFGFPQKRKHSLSVAAPCWLPLSSLLSPCGTLETKPTNTAQNPQEGALFYFNSGQSWAEKKEYDQAVTDYDQAIRIDPKNAAAFSHRGTAWLNMTENDKAIKDIDEAILAWIHYHAFAYGNRGLAWFPRKREYDKAITDFDKAIRIDPVSTTPHSTTGALLGTPKRDFDKAIRDYDKTIRLNPKQAYAFSNRGRAWGSIMEYDKAISDFDEAIRLDPKNAWAFAFRGMAWAAKGDSDKAKKDDDEARRLGGPDPWYLATGYSW